MRSKFLQVIVGVSLSFLFTLSQGGDQVFAGDQKKEDHNKKVQNKGSDKTGKGTTTRGLPCDIPPGQNVAHAEQDAKLASRLITGELVRVDGNNYVIKEENGKEVRFHTTERTEVTPVHQGDQISVAINNESQASWIRANRGTDRRTEHASADCNPN